jgi:hypothetical protein
MNDLNNVETLTAGELKRVVVGGKNACETYPDGTR